MKIVVAGASGFVGTALTPALRAAGYDVLRLVRGREGRTAGEVPWDPAAGELDATRLEDAAAIINLAGENIAAGRWTPVRRERIRQSRVAATRTLVVAMQRMQRRPGAFLSASAVGVYGDRGDELLTEASAPGSGFLADVCQAWETGADAAAAAGVRTARLRFGMILAGQGGALKKMLPLFRLGLGGRLGSGRQWTSWVSIDDVVAAILFALRNEACAGALNVVAPEPVTNAEFSRALGRTLRRPARLPVPRFALRLVFGRGMADEMLLASQRVRPARLTDLGFKHQHASIDAAFAAVVRRR